MDNEIKLKLEQFMNTGADTSDSYWELFKAKTFVNDAIVKAVEYGFEKGYKARDKEVEQIQQENEFLKNKDYNNILMYSQENSALKQEIEILRSYGNKTCTAMADEVLEALRDPRNDK